MDPNRQLAPRAEAALTVGKLPQIKDISPYPILGPTADEVRTVLAQNLGEQGLGEFDLTRVRVPTGGAVAWTIETLTGAETRPALSGIIVHWRRARAYWEKKLGEGGGGSNPPGCRSADGILGIGKPGGHCEKCPLAQFGSMEGNRQACKEMLLLFVVPEASVLPYVVVVPPMSIRPVRQYLLQLAGGMTPFYGAVTTLGLDRAANRGGITYSRIKPVLVGTLDGTSTARARQLHEAIKGKLDRFVDVAQEDLEGSPEEKPASAPSLNETANQPPLTG